MKKQVTLYSLNASEYPNIEIEVEIIENTAESLDLISSGGAFMAIKKAVVQARPAKAGEVVDTRPRVVYQGRVYSFSETTRTITPEEEANGAMVVINPDGEEYVIANSSKFESKYLKTSDGYVAIDGVKPFVRSNGNYAIQTSWGEEQIVLAGSCFCVQNLDDIYGITNAAFEGTYTTQPSEILQTVGKIAELKTARDSGTSVEPV